MNHIQAPHRGIISRMKHSPLHNYAVPGLTSFLVGGENRGVVRLFRADRIQQSDITPHSHRFDLECCVLTGVVRNRIWRPDEELPQPEPRSDFVLSEIEYNGEPGKYTKTTCGVSKWGYRESVYKTGDWYVMTADQIHSIIFEAGTEVLFFEGPEVSKKSVVLEPYVNGKIIPTFTTEPWMFTK